LVRQTGTTASRGYWVGGNTKHGTLFEMREQEFGYRCAGVAFLQRGLLSIEILTLLLGQEKLHVRSKRGFKDPAGQRTNPAPLRCDHSRASVQKSMITQTGLPFYLPMAIKLNEQARYLR